jgi:NADH dehydrogenase [ubiquinone] 1 alpha subcomplex assembly factor 1
VDAPQPAGVLSKSEGGGCSMRYSGAVHALAIVATLPLMPFAHAGRPPLDFSRSEVFQTLRVINDDVMGGVSTSRLSSTDGAMVFEGDVSLENSGGFASMRGPVRFPAESAALLLTVRGDGQRYKLTLKLDDGTGTAQYQAAFVAPREWQTLRFKPADFAASFRGRAVAAPIVRFVDVQYFGLLISDKQSGVFRIELKSIMIE